VNRERLPGEYVFGGSNLPIYKLSKWQLIVGLSARANNLESSLQAVELIPSITTRKRDELIPVRFSSLNKITRENRLSIAFDAVVLAKMTSQRMRIGKIVHGDHHVVTKVKVEGLYPQVNQSVSQIGILLSRTSPPEIELMNHCGECGFERTCVHEAIEHDHLSLLSSITGKERKKLNVRGIRTITHLSYTFRPRRRPKRLSGKPEKYHSSLKALAIRERKVYFAGNEELKIHGTPVYFDVEGIPDSDFYYLIGLRFNRGQEIVNYSLWAETEANEANIWDEFISILSDIDDPLLVHFGSYDATFLRQMRKRYREPPPDSKAAKAINNPVNMLSFIYSRIYFPTYTNGLKEIAGYLGFHWTASDANGITTIMWRKDWEKSRAENLKRDIILYNREDCEALSCVADFLYRITQGSDNSEFKRDTEIVKTNSLSDNELHRYHRIDFRVKSLEEINRMGYWDYQHQKILVRSSERLRRLSKISAKTAETKTRVDKIIYWPPPSKCPACGCGKLYKYRKLSKNLIDIHFGKTSIRKQVTKFMFDRYICTCCRATFYNTDRPWSREKYGINLMMLAVYLNIDAGITQSKTAGLINDLFGLRLSRNVIMRFKARASVWSGTTYENILTKLTTGTVIHADETQINLNGKMGYVWTFANAENVYYVYGSKREANLVQSMLKDFKGVVVSDFYSAYDSLSCPQQKCLLHMIRDLNDDLIKEPFNDEIRLLTNDFVELFRPILTTVDRFGLKTRHLHKHKIEVNQFFNKLTRRDYLTESAIKWKKRLEKNRAKLFTFLDYDNVPWNNNNAEHAMKAIAELRRGLSGLSTETGIKDYLVLLSVYGTCKFQGISFLEFLRNATMYGRHV
jgi:predicted RecB family nuclease